MVQVTINHLGAARREPGQVAVLLHSNLKEKENVKYRTWGKSPWADKGLTTMIKANLSRY